MSQTKLFSTLESLTNIIVGYLINLILVQILMHMIGYEITLRENASIGLILLFIAFGRTYIIRRIFNQFKGN